MGIDIETTGTDPARVYIIDAGFEFMNMISPRPAGEPSGYCYEQAITRLATRTARRVFPSEFLHRTHCSAIL